VGNIHIRLHGTKFEMVIGRMKAAAFFLLLALIGCPAAAAPLPDVERPNFAMSNEVIASLDATIDHLRAAEKNVPESWQIGRALDNCKDVRRTIAQWPDVGAYDPRGAERLWNDCQSTYRAVR
jgi:hypothetical protein